MEESAQQLEMAGPYSIGVDVGGTHTDLILATGETLVRSKAFTTHENYSEGIHDALGRAAAQLGLDVDAVLRDCRAFVNGSTIVTNVLTELRGAKVGVLVTRGFRDTFRLAGGARRPIYDDHAQEPPPDVVARDCIEEITERVNSDGEVAVALAEDEVRAAVRRLRERDVEAIAVCYLWSFSEPRNELRTREIIAEEHPAAFVTLSCEIHPVIREYERFMTAVFNCLSHRATTRYIDQLSGMLGQAGFAGALTFFQGIGGSVGVDAVKAEPIKLLASGPAGGVMGARHVAERLGIQNVLVGDMGGTSFDTSVLFKLEPSIAKRVSMGALRSGVDIVDVISVGAGGGSIAWVDSRGVPQVGPRSAGSEPGPACYGRGGTDPTVTDANLLLGLIDPGNYLNGRYTLDVGAAQHVITEKIADPLGWSTERAAAAIYDLTVVEMANALRVVSIERGHDPRDFTFFSYGGGLGLFAVEVCRRLGCPQLVIPDNSSAFSAYGVLIADYVRQYNKTVNWMLSDPERAPEVNSVASELIGQAIADAGAEGIEASELEIHRSGEFRFLGQVYEVTLPLPDRDLSADDAVMLARTFPMVYEQNYGEGTAWKGAPAVLLNLSIRAFASRVKPALREQEPTTSGSIVEPQTTRSVFLPIERRRESVGVYAADDMPPGTTVTGPCIVDVGDTTIYVPVDATCARDHFFNFVLKTA
jgi:N-methylhydantoinase A